MFSPKTNVEMPKRSNAIPILLLVIIVVRVLLLFFALSRPTVYRAFVTINIFAEADAEKTVHKVIGSLTNVPRQLIGSDAVAARAAQSNRVRQRFAEGGFRTFPNAKEPKDLESRVLQLLTITRTFNAGTQIETQVELNRNSIILSYCTVDPEESQLLLEAIVEAYEQVVKDACQSENEKYSVKVLSRTMSGVPRHWWQQLWNH